MSSNKKILLKDVRLAFPVLWKPQAPKSGEGAPAFSASFIMPKNHPQIAELKALMIAVAKDQWPQKFAEILKSAQATDKLCLHDGDTKSEYEGYAGAMFVSSRSRTRVSVFDRDRTELSEADGKPYSGCYVNASLELWAQDNQYGKRINAQLRGVQFLRDGDAFAGGSRPADADEFEEIGMADGAEAASGADDDLLG